MLVYQLSGMMYVNGNCDYASMGVLVHHLIGSPSYFVVDAGEPVPCEEAENYTSCNTD